ncbi:protein kinase subdomain-containing protein PKL/CAK/Fmp29 [Ganoderma leucocontextum]|nr:protein kinase subdomain-containing protein PKL/CAK/Fmp29 [Ganoderma leucocontextum]
MLYLRSTKLITKSLAAPVWLSLRRPLSSPRSSSTVATPTRPPCRAFSFMAHPPIYDDNLFIYTTGNWLVNDELRHAERRRDFDVAGLSQLAAKSVGRSPDDILRLEKLAEGGFNRTFLITMHDGFRMVARIPYPVTTPKYFAVASEVATLDRLRSAGLPVPDVYGYSPTPDNAARTEHIFMAFVEGINLDAIWYELEEKDIISISRQIAELEAKMMSIPFPAGGSLYFPEDLANAPGSVSGITLEDKRFCVGPDTHPHLWCGRRSELDVNRGPYESAGAALKSGPEKEVTFLRRFGRPLLPFQRARRDVYQYREQLPSHHIENLDLFSSIAPSLIPNDPTLVRFCMRHPDLQPSNIIVSWPRDANSYVVNSLIDWQHTSVLPLFLQAGIPHELQNHGDIVSRFMARPSLPDNFDNLDETEQREEREHYRRRLVHYHYVDKTEKYNKLHSAALMDPAGVLRRRLFYHARSPWRGESLELKLALIRATEKWETLTGSGGSPCPIVFDPDEVRKTSELETELEKSDELLEKCRDLIGVGPEDWMPAERYKAALAISQQLKVDALAATESAKERAEIEAHWPFDDRNEDDYM